MPSPRAVSPPEPTVDVLLQRVAELEAALSPFAGLAALYSRRGRKERLVSTFGADVTVGDFVRAQQVLTNRGVASSA